MSVRIGCLFSGYGGLSMAVQQVIPDAEHAWFCEFDPAPSRILAHHWPDVPNLQDITKVDWATVPPIDILTGGFPCQDVSVAGRRAGMKDGTRSGLWSYMRDAIDQLRPGLVVIENVGGLFSAGANRIVEPCPYGLGDDGSGGHALLLRAADAVLGDLASLGYDAEWTALRAADVGAPHGRLRVFIVAYPEGEPWGVGDGDRGAVADLRCGGSGRRAEGPEQAGRDHAPVGPDPRGDRGRDHRRLMPTPRASDGTKGGPGQRGSSGDLMLPSAVAQLLPTPEAKNGAAGPDYARAGRIGSGGDDLVTVIAKATEHLLPTPMVGSSSPAAHGQISGDYRRRMDEALADFGPYAPAIARWEAVLGRPAPAPTEPGKNRPRLSAVFVEWLMGLPAGHVTGVPDLTRNQQLKALGNGVVPQQCAAAVAHLIDRSHQPV